MEVTKSPEPHYLDRLTISCTAGWAKVLVLNRMETCDMSPERPDWTSPAKLGIEGTGIAFSLLTSHLAQPEATLDDIPSLPKPTLVVVLPAEV